jgi:hypothetical protein
MTPFDTYFEERIVPALGKGAPAAAVKMVRQSAAEIWNAALDAALVHEVMFDDTPHVSGVLVNANDIEMLKTAPDEEAQAIHERRGKS